MTKEAKWAAKENLDRNFLFKTTDTWKNSVEIKQFVSSTYYVQRNKINIYFLLNMCHTVLEVALLVLVLTLVFMNPHNSWR